MTRRQLMNMSVQAVAAAAASRFIVVESYSEPKRSTYQRIFEPLDSLIQQYMRDMNSPGMTFVMADRDGVQRVATYGFRDREGKTEVKPVELFQVGSISKSFVANCLLQLRQEGKVDLFKPIT